VAFVTALRPATAGPPILIPGRQSPLLASFLALACAAVALSAGDQMGRNLRVGPQPELLQGGVIGVAHNNGDRKPYLMASTDGARFSIVAGPLTSGDRDPSLMIWDDRYWMAATPITAGHSFDVWRAKDPTQPDNWVHTVVDVSAIGTVFYTWAPEWFIDPSEEAHQRVHVLFAATTTNDIRGPFRIYETHPTDRVMTEWSAPVEVTGASLPGDQIDPFVVYAPEIGPPGKPYKLWYKENDGGDIEYMESASLTSGYTVVESGNWARWKVGRSIEAICLVRLDDGSWRAYFNENAGLTTVGNFYSDSLDGWATWSPRESIDTESLMSHGTYIRVAFTPGP
jgi:hypothetical protein